MTNHDKLFHPPIDPESNWHKSPERSFAELQLNLLGNHADLEDTTFGDYDLRLPQLISPDFIMQGNNAYKLRLTRTPAFVMSGQQYITEPSDRFVVMKLDYGVRDSDDEVNLWSDDYDWKDYIVTIIDREDLDQVEVLRYSNGEPLSLEDLMCAEARLVDLGEYLRSFDFDELEEYDDTTPIISHQTECNEVPETGFGSFTAADYFRCASCSANSEVGDLPCSHNYANPS